MLSKGEFEVFEMSIGQFLSHELSNIVSEWVDKKYLLEIYSKGK